MRPRIGILGGGQLGRMIGLAGLPLGFEFKIWDPAPHAPAAAIGQLFPRDFHDLDATDDFAAGLDMVTYEFENVPAGIVERLNGIAPCRPGINSLSISQDRYLEKLFFAERGVPTGEWRRVDSRHDLAQAFQDLGPSILKTRRFGYDGKGQLRLQTAADIDTAWEQLKNFPLIVEQLVPFVRELSIVAVRSPQGTVACWPLVQNEHRHGILHKTTAPAPDVPPQLDQQAREVARKIMDALNHIGVLTIEFFQVGDQLLANEMAPRVHNSGHWTIEGAATSQFENHLRAITGLPLGPCTPRFPSVMINCIGTLPPAEQVLAIPGAHFHDYGKSPRAARKVGHVTICDEPVHDAHTDRSFAQRVAHIEQLCLAATEQARDL